MTHKTRESWLMEAVDHVTELFAQTKEDGEPVSVPPVHISCGFPAGNVRKTIGQCWKAESSEDGVGHVFVSPVLKDPVEVLGVIIHELCHAIDNCQSGHKGRFRKLAVQMGLEGKMTATHVGDALAGLLKPIVQTLGEYPHPALNLSAAPVKKQTTRMVKAQCKEVIEGGERSGETCGYLVRTTHKWLEVGVPDCPAHFLPLTVEEKEPSGEPG